MDILQRCPHHDRHGDNKCSLILDSELLNKCDIQSISDKRVFELLTGLHQEYVENNGTKAMKDDESWCTRVTGIYMAFLQCNFRHKKPYLARAKVLAKSIVALAPRDPAVLSMALKICQVVRYDLRDEITVNARQKKQLGNQDDILQYLIGANQPASTNNVRTRYSRCEDVSNRRFLNDFPALRNRMLESIRELEMYVRDPWKESTNPAIEVVEQMSRCVLVYGVPCTGLFHMLQTVQTRRRDRMKKMDILIVQDPDGYYLETVRKFSAAIGAKKRPSNTTLVVVPYTSLATVISLVDRVLLGVRTVFSSGSVLSYAGTKALCKLAAVFRKTVIVVTSMQMVAHFDEDEYRKATIASGDNKHLEIQEIVPAKHIGFFVTPTGMFPPCSLIFELDGSKHDDDKDIVEASLVGNLDSANEINQYLIYLKANIDSTSEIETIGSFRT